MNVHLLAQAVMASPEFQPGERVYVSVYRRHQSYGGPEEGGWWYNRSEFVGGIPMPNREQAEAFLDGMERQVEEENRKEAPARHRAMASLPGEDQDTAYHSEGYIPAGWSDGGELYVTIEERLGEGDDMHTPRPRYE